jgi:hypothetical protein
MNTVRILLSIVVNHGWTLSQMDVENAFMHGDLQEEIYMEIPPGHPNIVIQIWFANYTNPFMD